MKFLGSDNSVSSSNIAGRSSGVGTVHVVTPIHSQQHNLAPIVVSAGQQVGNLAQLIATPSTSLEKLPGKVSFL